MTTYRIAIAGLGAIGLKVARTIDRGDIPGLTLTAVAVRDAVKAERNLADFKTKPKLVALEHLADHADLVIECIPAAHFKTVAEATISKGRMFMPLSVGQMLPNMHLVEMAKKTGARILVPTGALLGLDAVRACAEDDVHSVTILTRKPPAGLKGAPHLVKNNIDVDGLTEAKRVFEGSARDAIIGFPANVNVAVALSLAGIGPDRTRIEIWADPAVTRNTHTIEVKAAASDLTMTIANVPSPETPATGKITALSVIAALRRLTAPLVVGT